MPRPIEGTPEYIVWKFFLDYQDKNHGIPPTMEEVCEVTGLNFRASVKHIIKNLEKAGVMEAWCEEGLSRRYRALREPKQNSIWEESPFDNLTAMPVIIGKAPD